MRVIEETIGPRKIGEARLVSAKSFLIDRIVPQCELIVLPEITLRGGALRLESGQVRLKPMQRRRLAAFKIIRDVQTPASRWAFDMRLEDPENWAHFLNDHLPLFFHAAEVTGRDPLQALLLLPSDAPDYLVKAAAVFGLECLKTDAVVTGDGVAARLTPYIVNRTVRRDWVRYPFPRRVIDDLMQQTGSGDLPRKVFLTRHKQRSASNLPELETYLAQKGYVAVRPETLSAADQFRLFLGAVEMVALTGAGMAPLLYTDPPARGPAQLIEIQPCGHMSSVYREMAAQVGCRFAAVRGRIKPEYVAPAYAFDTPFRKFSQDNFHVDLDALERAFEIVSA